MSKEEHTQFVDVMSGIAQGVVNIETGLTKIEEGSRVHKCMAELCKMVSQGKIRVSEDEYKLRCRYDDCEHPVAVEEERVTCPKCRDDLGLDPVEGDSNE